MSWRDFALGAPDLAGAAAGRIASGSVAYLATVSADGRPRVHPVSPVISSDDRLFVFMEPTSPKGHDLRRDGRFALHSAVEDVFGTGGEVFVRGVAAAVEDPADRRVAADAYLTVPEERYVLFELGVEDVLVTMYVDGVPSRRRWRRR